MILQIINYYKYFIHKLRIRRLKKTIGLWGGNNVFIQPDFQIGHEEQLFLHNYVRIGNAAFIDANGGVEIESGFVSGPHLTIISVNHIFENASKVPFSNDIVRKKVFIGKNCWLGANVFIVPGVSLGEGCIVAGGSVVTKSFPSLCVLGGNPAKILKTRDRADYERSRDGGYADWLL